MQSDLLAGLPYKSLAELLDYQAQHLPNKICLLYPDSSSDSLCYASATFAQVNASANRLANKYVKQMDVSQRPVVVGLLANTSVDFLLTVYGLVKLGVVVFPLSIRNSKAALEHLIITTGISYLIVEPGQIQIKLDGLTVISLETANWNDDDVDDGLSCSVNCMEQDSLDRVQLIFHSSGSTSFPKPLPYTNRNILHMPMMQTDINKDFWSEDDVVLACGALFHLIAFSTAIACMVFGGTFALPLTKTYPPTPKQLVANLRVEQINKIVSVPILLEQLVNELEYDSSASYTLLSRMKFVMYGGAIMPERVGRQCSDNGVHLVSCYGTTETGMTMFKDLNAPITRWKWMKIVGCRKPFVTFRPDDNVMVLLPNDPFCVAGITNQPDGSYSTNDIFIEDPPGSGEYRIEGRQDDTLVHVNGEKTNPVPMEAIIHQFPIVKRAIVFGHQRLCTGVLIELNRNEAENYSPDEILDKVWEAVAAANQLAPSHSRIIRQMVKCLPMNKVLPITEKGNVIRKRVDNEYGTLINNLYENFLKPKQESELTSEKKQDWTEDSLRQYLQKLVSKLSLKSHQDFQDTSKSVFELGFDSLHAVQLRNELYSKFHAVGFNFVYEFSSIDSMVNALLSRTGKTDMKKDNNDRHHYMITENLIDKYINLMKNDPTVTNTLATKKNGERICLVTGANGSLGSWVVLNLLKQKSVTKVFCLFRGQNKTRIVQEFEQRYQPTDIFNDNNNRIVLLNNMILFDELLGQDVKIYNQLCHEVTDIIHSAYRMDFNLTVRDFEKDGILGTYHLLKLARKANARFHFISSIAASGSGIIPVVKEEPLSRRPELPIAQGYGQSKYICEHLDGAAKQLWNVSTDIYRIGQMSGDSEHGVWNTSEMISMIICIGGGELGQMPSQGQDIRWIPVDIAASSIVDIAIQDYIEHDNVHHILNPHSITWSTFLDYLHMAGLHFRIVNPVEWLDVVLASQTGLVKLSSFFDTFFTSKDGFQISEYETVKSEARSKHLHECSPINVELIRKYLAFWHKTGFLTKGYQ